MSVHYIDVYVYIFLLESIIGNWIFVSLQILFFFILNKNKNNRITLIINGIVLEI